MADCIFLCNSSSVLVTSGLIICLFVQVIYKILASSVCFCLTEAAETL